MQYRTTHYNYREGQKIQEKFNDDKIASLSSVEKDYIKIFVIPFFNQLEEYEMIMTETGNINFIKKRI